MAKEKGQKRKINKKGLLIFFSVICVVVAGIVLGVTYWPAKTADISNIFVKYYQESYTETGDAYKQYEAVNDFILTNKAEFVNHSKDDYANEMTSYIKVINSMYYLSDFYRTSFDTIINDKINKKDARALQSYLESSKSNAKKMGNYIISHKSEMTNFAVINVGWESIRDYYKAILNDYINLTSKLHELSLKNLKGVYGNQMFINITKASADFFTSINDKLFNEKGFIETNTAVKIAQNASVFSKHYYVDKTESISNYYLDEAIQEEAKKVGLLEEKTENKVNFVYLISNLYNYSGVSLSESQKPYVQSSINFLMGGI